MHQLITTVTSPLQLVQVVAILAQHKSREACLPQLSCTVPSPVHLCHGVPSAGCLIGVVASVSDSSRIIASRLHLVHRVACLTHHLNLEALSLGLAQIGRCELCYAQIGNREARLAELQGFVLPCLQLCEREALCVPHLLCRVSAVLELFDGVSERLHLRDGDLRLPHLFGTVTEVLELGRFEAHRLELLGFEATVLEFLRRKRNVEQLLSTKANVVEYLRADDHLEMRTPRHALGD